jgi:hypothetical protein
VSGVGNQEYRDCGLARLFWSKSMWLTRSVVSDIILSDIVKCCLNICARFRGNKVDPR